MAGDLPTIRREILAAPRPLILRDLPPEVPAAPPAPRAGPAAPAPPEDDAS